jgi:hypothetical protein
MAVTQYQIFCRYLNEAVNRPLTNNQDIGWIGAEELSKLEESHRENQAEYNNIKNRILNGEIKENQLSLQELVIYENGKKYESIMDRVEKNQIVLEHCILEPSDSLYNDTNFSKKKAQMQRDLDLYEYVIEENAATNPKFDMVFVYDGVAYGESRTGKSDYNPAPDDDKQIPYVYYDRMKRIQFDPWFLFSSHASLNSAMIKAKELVNILGKENVKIGKVVPLEQYVEIV